MEFKNMSLLAVSNKKQKNNLKNKARLQNKSRQGGEEGEKRETKTRPEGRGFVNGQNVFFYFGLVF